MKYSVLIFIFISLGITTSYSQNDTIPFKDIYDYTLEELMELEVSGVSRYTQSISDVPNSIQVISKQQIIDRGYNDLSDVLKDVQGIDITSNAGRFGELYSIHGITGNDRFLILINGHKINPASGTFISVGNSISVRYAERVEIIFGPASAIYGADAFSGIINIVYKDYDSEKRKMELSFNSNYGSFNSSDISLNSSIKVNKNLSFNFFTRFYRSNGFDITASDSIYNIINDYKQPILNKCEQPIYDYNIYFNAKYKNFSLNYFRQQFDEGNALGHNPEIYIFDKDNKWKMSTDIVWASYNKKIKDNGELNFDISYKFHIQDKNTIFHKWTIPGTVGNTYKQYMTGKDNTILALLTYNWKVTDNFHFILGIDNEYNSSIPPYANDEILGNSFQYIGDYAQIIEDSLTIKENRSSVFGQITFSPSRFLNIVIGARYDYSTRYKGVFNPRLGFVFSPTKSTKIRFIYGKAFQSPSLFFQYEQFGTPNLTMLSTSEIQKNNPNWHLQNQIVSSIELGLSQKIGQNIEFSINTYFNDLQNLIERNMFAVYPFDSVYNKYFDNYTSGVRNENIGIEKIIGADISFNTKVSPNIILYSYYSYIKAVSIDTYTNEETSLPRISNHKFWFGFTVQNLFKYLTISPSFKWVGDMYNLNTKLFPNNIQAGYKTLDINFILNNLSKKFKIYVNFDNILNQKIEHAGLYSQSGIYTAVIPQPGFSFKAGIEFFFWQ